MMYWGKYVQHDNTRDGMGQFLALTRNVQKFTLQWNPTSRHDLHEAQTLLYSSTGTGPYNEGIDAITVNEWWILAQNDVIEMTKRRPSVDVQLRWLDAELHLHGPLLTRQPFHEVQSYGPDNYEVRPCATTTSKEWFRPNPPLPSIKWGPRNNTNIQQSALLIALNYVARNRDTFLENYWIKNQRAVNRGRNEAPYAWVIPAAQRRKAEAAELVNALRRQGLEVSRATSAFKAGIRDGVFQPAELRPAT
jgi:hypothetical protein